MNSDKNEKKLKNGKCIKALVLFHTKLHQTVEFIPSIRTFYVTIGFVDRLHP